MTKTFKTSKVTILSGRIAGMMFWWTWTRQKMAEWVNNIGLSPLTYCFQLTLTLSFSAYCLCVLLPPELFIYWLYLLNCAHWHSYWSANVNDTEASYYPFVVGSGCHINQYSVALWLVNIDWNIIKRLEFVQPLLLRAQSVDFAFPLSLTHFFFFSHTAHR